MTPTWEYNRGTWTEIEDPLRDIKTDDLDDELKEAGYGKDSGYGDGREIGACIQLYRTKNRTPITERYPYFACVTVGTDTWEAVFMPDLPSQLMFLRDFAPVMQQQTFLYSLQILETAIEKTFHAWHGHGVHGICHHCDPFAVKAQHERRERAAKNKANHENHKTS